MQRRLVHMLAIVCVAGIIAILHGCGTTADSRFYRLSALDDRAEKGEILPVPPGISIGLGPVEIADYLDRPQIVTTGGGNELSFSEFHRWGGSLTENVIRVLQENLAKLLATDRIFLEPKIRFVDVDYWVAVQILALDAVPGEGVKLKASWTISRNRDKTEVLTKTSQLSEEIKGSGYGPIVAAMSRALARLSQEIASEANKIAQNP